MLSILEAIGLFFADVFAVLRGGLGAGGLSRIGRTVFGAFAKVLPGAVIQFLLFFGVTLAVNTMVVPAWRDIIASYFTGLPAVWIDFIALTRIDQATTIILSALAIAVSRKIRLRPGPNFFQNA